MCMYVRMYVCMYVCMHLCMYVCMYVCVYVCVHVCMYVCMCAGGHVRRNGGRYMLMQAREQSKQNRHTPLVDIEGHVFGASDKVNHVVCVLWCAQGEWKGAV